MKSLRIIGIMVVISIVIGVAFIISQPSNTHVQKSIVIRGSPYDIASVTESFQSFNAWSPWNKSDPEVRYTIVAFEGFSGTFYSDIKLEPQGDDTKVTWIYDGHNNSFKQKAMWILLREDLNEQYDEGLTALKEIVERKVLEKRSTPRDSITR